MSTSTLLLDAEQEGPPYYTGEFFRDRPRANTQDVGARLPMVYAHNLHEKKKKRDVLMFRAMLAILQLLPLFSTYYCLVFRIVEYNTAP
jgi:hypothetical protein